MRASMTTETQGDNGAIDLGHPLSAWTVPHAGTVSTDSAGCLVFADGEGLGTHLLRLVDVRALGRHVRLTITFRPSAGGDAGLYIDHWGELTVARISRDGRVLATGISEQVSVTRRSDGFMVASVSYFSSSEVIAFGPAQQTSRYVGAGKAQIVIAEIAVSVVPPAPIAPEARLVVVEYGARFFLAPAWRAMGPVVRPVLIQPDPEPLPRLQHGVRGYADALVLRAVLGETAGTRVLHVTENPFCSSVLPPEVERLAAFKAALSFTIRGQIEVEGHRYDALHNDGQVPAPDVLRIDARGAEGEALGSFGGLLSGCVAVEVDTYLSPIYAGQSLIGDIVARLAPHGFGLVKLQPMPGFDGEIVACRACFLARAGTRREAALEKLRLVRLAWALG